jgi:hypothetical protein
MRVTRIALVAIAATAVTFGAATGASAATTRPGAPAQGHRTVDELRQHIDQHLGRLTAAATALRTRVDANTTLTAAEKAELDADITKLLTDAATARQQVDAATDKAGVRAASAALQTVHTDHAKLSTDRQAIRQAHKAAGKP